MTRHAGAVGIVRKFEKGLTAGIVLCLLIAVCLFFWIDTGVQRTPYLNVQILPDEMLVIETEPDQTLARPLFWAGRRPVELFVEGEGGEQPVEEVQAIEGVKLIGVLAKKEHYTALLEVDGKVERVKLGDRVKQWDVVSVTVQQVQLSRQERISVLSLKRELHQSIKLDL